MRPRPIRPQHRRARARSAAIALPIALPIVLTAMAASLGLSGCASVRGDGGTGAAAAREAATIERIERERFDAMTRRDGFALARYLAEDLTYCHSNALCETRAQFIEGIQTGRTMYRAITVDEIRPRRVGDTWVVNGRIGITGEIGGRPAEMRVVYTDVYVKTQGAWRLAAWQSTRVP